jgi:hypothetical protein
MWAVCTLDCRLWIVDCILYNVYDILCIVHGALSSGSHFLPGGSRGRSPPRIVYIAMCRGMHENIYIYIYSCLGGRYGNMSKADMLMSWWKLQRHVVMVMCRCVDMLLCRYIHGRGHA